MEVNQNHKNIDTYLRWCIANHMQPMTVTNVIVDRDAKYYEVTMRSGCTKRLVPFSPSEEGRWVAIIK